MTSLSTIKSQACYTFICAIYPLKSLLLHWPSNIVEREKKKKKKSWSQQSWPYLLETLSSQLSISKSISGNIKIIPTKVARNKSMPQQENSNAFEKCKLCSVLSILNTLGYCHSGSKLPNKPD